MYPPAHHLESDFTKVRRLMATYPLATLITATQNEILTTPLPLIYVEDPENPFGRLLGHFDRQNPQRQTLTEGSTAKVLFQGPNAYISPNVYASPQLPTWNYIQAELQVRVSPITSHDELRHLLRASNDFFERDSATPFVLPESHAQTNRLLDYIFGFSLTILSWKGRFKLSQDKNPQDKALAAQELNRQATASREDFITAMLD